MRVVRSAFIASRRIPPAAILWTGYLLFLVYAYPGYLSPDPIQQLYEARVGNVGDWHPPMMGFLWKHIDSLVPGTFGMLVAQSAPFLVGLYLLARRVISPRKAACVAVAILLFPPVLTTMAVIWKDSQMAGYLLAGTALLLSKQLRWRLAGCGLIWLGTAMRYNALAATLPIVVLLFEWRPGVSRVRRYAISVAMWLAITFTASRANAALVDYKMHPEYLGLYHDIAGVMHFSPGHNDATLESLLPGVLHLHKDIAGEIDRRYGYTGSYFLAFGEDRVFEFPSTDEQRATVRRAWFKLIRHAPAAYLQHRFHVSLEILAMTRDPVVAPVWDGFAADSDIMKFDSLQLAMRHSAWQAWWVHSLQDIGQTFPFHAYLYFFVALALLWPCRRSPVELTLVLSGLCYEGSLFAAAVADARYSHWMITCTVLAYVLVIARAFHEQDH